eukprot:6485933-Prymnesium_polylepis.1
MLIFNSLLVQRFNRTADDVVSGYPVGPVDFPTWSLLCRKAPCGTDARTGQAVKQSSACIQRTLEEMAPR